MTRAAGTAEAAAVERALTLIRERGGRSTTPRRLVLEALLTGGEELSTAEDLLDRIQAEHPDVTESTVYRTLTLLRELDVVDHVHLGHGPSHWYVRGERPHYYLTCTTCGTAIESRPEAFEALAAQIADESGFRLDGGHFAITGTCGACRQEMSR